MSQADGPAAASPPISVLIVDDDEAFRHSTARVLVQHGYSCVEAASSADATEILDAEQDIAAVLCDIKMPGESGLELLTQLTADCPDVAVVMTTGLDDPQIADVAFGFGAFGYLVKPFDTNQLLVNLAGALKRRELEIARRGQMRTLEPTIARTKVLSDLTPRELEVLGLIASGLVNKQIAQQLGLSLNTVRNHTQNILYKLQAHSKLEAVATAVREGVIDYPTEAVDPT
jgi:DNA-binding NarL/FixJ family response regulator